ncbi:MAG: hypothetical protein FRX49_02175 [Trebouxia sp. A1-2]|nr:MAG: hypothetical protein FRX49_02175 [Trebouxia sp. A1-2]
MPPGKAGGGVLDTAVELGAQRVGDRAPALYPEMRGAKAELQEVTQRQAQGIWRQQDSPGRAQNQTWPLSEPGSSLPPGGLLAKADADGDGMTDWGAFAAVKSLKGDLGGRVTPCRTALADANSSVKNAASSRPAYAA